MRSEQLAEFEGLLRQQHAKLSGDLEELNQELKLRGDCATTDQVDLASLQESLQRAAALRDQKRAVLSEVEAALQRIANGRYGVSEKTGDAIPVARLRAVPWARD